jgi:hypothetical protein
LAVVVKFIVDGARPTVILFSNDFNFKSRPGLFDPSSSGKFALGLAPFWPEKLG